MARTRNSNIPGHDKHENSMLAGAQRNTRKRDVGQKENSTRALDGQLFNNKFRDLEKTLDDGINEMQKELGQFQEQLDNLREEFHLEAEKTEEEINLVKTNLKEACDVIMERVTILRSDVVNIGGPSAGTPQPKMSAAQKDTLRGPKNGETRRSTRKRAHAPTETFQGKGLRVFCRVCKKNLAASYIAKHLKKGCKRQ